ncbi:MAG: hypothetical protein PUI10_05380 [Prevotellaceae bacterium]|nr:hypothetical protein [Prevotellaceae bacterium]MDD7107970.1 hypothetical protein [Prevotellaceae bacterium]
MKKILTVAIVLIFTGCGENKVQEDSRDVVYDSLQQIISQKNAELNDIMGTFNDIQEGFREINMAQGRVNLNGIASEKMSKEDIMENISFIQRTMQLNRERIARLQQQLKSSSLNADKLSATIEGLTLQLNEKQKQIDQLEAQLKDKDLVIEKQGKEITRLNDNVGQLTASDAAKAEALQKQDKEMHTAWYVFGTKKELKSQGILKSSDVLKSSDFNKNYFTRIDIRVVKSIKLYSKNVELLTSHPSDSYSLERDAQKQYILYINNPDAFWSVSRYLVMLVK